MYSDLIDVTFRQANCHESLGKIANVAEALLLNLFIVTPSYLIEKKRDFTSGVKQLEQLGFKVLNPEFPTDLPHSYTQHSPIPKSIY